ncbi:MAG: CHAP domain-containing protein [Clostridia bacterium]|nr:CHAP domain-containing protein [Clostridia bacterium]
MKKVISVILTVLLIVGCMPVYTFTASAAVSQTNAVNWAKSKLNYGLDYDGNGNWCVDLIYYYYNYLGATCVYGNACDYIYNSLPSGWQRITVTSGFVPKPGDIAVWKPNYGYTGPLGHIGIVVGADSNGVTAINQRFSGQTYCTQNWFSMDVLQCVIRPKFSEDITVSQITNCNYTLTVKANSGRIPLYDTATTYTESDHWYNNKTSAFNIYSTKKVTLSNGTVRYYFYVSGEQRGYYVTWNPNIMTVVQKHTYSNSCDTTCNTCGATRSISHTYSNACDTSCNICGATRSISHTYSSVCDITCNVCGNRRASVFNHSYSNVCDGSCNSCGYTRTPPHSYKTYTTPATTAKDGTEVVKCSICSKVSSQSTIKAIKSIALSSTSAVYNGKRRTPAVIVKDSQGNIISANNYTVTYQSGRINVGKYKVTIKFKDKYSGIRNLYFTILPPKTTISKLTAGRKSFTVNISKKSSQVSGYQVQYATNTKFKNAKHKTIGSYKTTKYTFKNLTAKKTYYVRVRTYKTVNGKHYYSPWSAYKTVKTK